jgi:predicted extracellular nuclease
MRRLIRFVAPLILLASNAGAQLVISQVYGGGGNSGATYKNDFIEIFNRGSVTVSLTNMSVQYASSTGSFGQVTLLTGSVAPGKYYLVQEAAGAGGTVNLPQADATGSINMGATALKVALVNSTAALSCGATAAPVAPCTPNDMALIVDMVGAGSGTTFFEGSNGPVISNTTGALRANSGCTDTNNNGLDFTAAAPTPRNSTTAAFTCAVHVYTDAFPKVATVNMPYSLTFTGGGGTGPYTFARTLGTLPDGLTLVGGVLSGTPTDTASYTFTIQATDSASTPASGSQSFTITPAAAMTFLPNSLAGLIYPALLSQLVTTNRSGCDYTTTGAPPFLSLTQATHGVGNFTLASTSAPPVGTYNFTVNGSCANGTGSQAYALAVSGTLITFSPTTLPNGTKGTAYSQNLTTNGTGCSFSITSGALFAGFSLTTADLSTATIAGTPGLAGSASFTVSANCVNGVGSQAYTLTVPLACNTSKTYIHDVQGSGATSPMVGMKVELEGIVTGSYQSKTTGLGGFYMQEADANWDNNPLTSEGIFVYDNAFGVPVTTGDRVRVQGTVDEFGTTSTLTELGSVGGVLVCDSGNSFTISPITLPVSTLSVFEQYEGMAVIFPQQMVVTSTYEEGSYGSVDLSPNSRLYTPTAVVAPGSAAIALESNNSRSLITLDHASTLSNAALYPAPYPEGGGMSASNTVRTGNWVNFNSTTNTYTPVTGVMDDRYGSYRIEPLGSYTFHTPMAVNPRKTAPDAVGGRIRVGSANLYNFFTTLGSSSTCGPSGTVSCRGASNATEYQRQLNKLVAELTGLSADILGLSELENNAPGIPNAATVNSIAALVNALNAAAGAGTYAYIDTGTTGTDSIRNALVYKPARVTPVGAFAVYLPTVSGVRPSIAQLFKPATGSKTSLQQFTVVVNHFRSKSSDCGSSDPDTGDGQGYCNLNRLTMAQGLIDWVAGNPTNDPALLANRKVLMVGDYNSYFMEDPIQAMINPAFTKTGYLADANAIYTNLIDKFLGVTAYSYQYNSESGYIDHALTSPTLTKLVTGVSEWHNNSDEPPFIDYNTESKSADQIANDYAPDAFRASDHDPILIGFNPLPGDLNDDGVVDAADATLLRAAIGKPVGAAGVDRRMDYDGDGVISLNDYRLWAALYQQYLLASN